jgi:hypothetical protein
MTSAPDTDPIFEAIAKHKGSTRTTLRSPRTTQATPRRSRSKLCSKTAR